MDSVANIVRREIGIVANSSERRRIDEYTCTTRHRDTAVDCSILPVSRYTMLAEGSPRCDDQEVDTRQAVKVSEIKKEKCRAMGAAVWN